MPHRIDKTTDAHHFGACISCGDERMLSQCVYCEEFLCGNCQHFHCEQAPGITRKEALALARAKWPNHSDVQYFPHTSEPWTIYGMVGNTPARWDAATLDQACKNAGLLA